MLGVSHIFSLHPVHSQCNLLRVQSYKSRQYSSIRTVRPSPPVQTVQSLGSGSGLQLDWPVTCQGAASLGLEIGTVATVALSSNRMQGTFWRDVGVQSSRLSENYGNRMVIGGCVTRVKDPAAVAPELGQYRRLNKYWFPMTATLPVGKQWQITEDDNKWLVSPLASPFILVSPLTSRHSLSLAQFPSLEIAGSHPNLDTVPLLPVT